MTGADHFDDHFDEVMDYTECLKFQYHELGLALGLSENTLKQCQHEKEAKSLKNVLRAWLRGDPQKRTWRFLVKAVNTLDEKVAKEIASQHPAGTETLYLCIAIMFSHEIIAELIVRNNFWGT